MSTQTYITTKMLRVVTFQWWQYGWFQLCFVHLYMLPTPCGPGPISLVRLSSPWASHCWLPDATLTMLWDKSLCFFSCILVGQPLSQQTLLFSPAPPPTLFLPPPSVLEKGDAQPSRCCHMLPEEQAQPLLPTEPLQSQGSHLHCNTSQPRNPPWGSPGPYFPSLQNWENTSTVFTMLLWGQKWVHIKHSE